MQPGAKLPTTEIHKIALFRALQLGDLMCAVPAFRALRGQFPQASITLIGMPWMREFTERFSGYFDHFIEFPGYPGLPEKEAEIGRLPDFLARVQEEQYDLAIQMHGSGGITNSLVMLFGARYTAGFYLPGQYCPDPERFLAYPVHEPEIWRHLRLMEFLDIPLQGEYLDFPLCSSDWEEFHDLRDRHNLDGVEYAVVHPGARALARRWPSAWFAQVADGLAQRGLRVVLTGTGEEECLVEEVASKMKTEPINLAGKTSLGGLGALLNSARLLVSNDTGVSHLAAALCLPSVVLFTASDPERWAPLDRELHRPVAWATSATPDYVLEEVDDLLRKETASFSQSHGINAS